jgi:hypothetical protein
MSAVAIRHSLDIPGVSAVIVGSRLNSSSLKHTDASLAAFSFSLDEDDRRRIAEAQEGLEDVPGDCGDEYRRPPFLTAAGDLSDHLSDSEDRLKRVDEVIRKGGRVEFSSSSVWEPIAVCLPLRSRLHLAEFTRGLLPRCSIRQHHHDIWNNRDLPAKLQDHWRLIRLRPNHTHLRHHLIRYQRSRRIITRCDTYEDNTAGRGGL